MMITFSPKYIIQSRLIIEQKNVKAKTELYDEKAREIREKCLKLISKEIPIYQINQERIDDVDDLPPEPVPG